MAETMKKIQDVKEDEETKMLGALVPIDLFWQFKQIAAQRKESMQVAIMNAAYLYLDAEKGEARKNG